MINSVNFGIITYNTTGSQVEVPIVPNDQIEIRIVDSTNSVQWSVASRILSLTDFPNSSLVTDSDGSLTFTGTKTIITNGKICGFAINIISLGSASSVNLEYRCPEIYVLS